LRKERLGLERKQQRLQEKLTNLESEKQKWRDKFLQAMNKQRQIAANWNAIVALETQSIQKPPQDWLTTSLSKFTIFRINITEQYRDLFANLINGTPLVSIERVENAQLWQKYAQCKETLAKFGTRKHVSVTTDEPWQHTHMHIADYVNEVLLWHPVRDEAQLYRVISQGFDVRLADLRGALGYGIYFWENLDVILSEAKPNSENTVYFVLSRVCLGTPHVATKFLHGIASPPISIVEKSKEKKTPKKTKPKEEGDKETEDKEEEPEKREVICDSVVARVKALNKSPSPKQYVVYDRSQAYPAFIVALKVSGKNQEKTVSPREDEAHEEQQEDEEDEPQNGKEGQEQADEDN